MGSVKSQPKITVGILDRQTEVAGRFDGNYRGDEFGPVSGRFSAKTEAEMIVLTDEANQEICRSASIRLTGQEGSAFSLFNVTIGNRFHWERTEDQTFHGDLILCWRKDGTISAINEISLEDYLTSVISSEMCGDAPKEFLKIHAILSRSWLLAALDHKKKKNERSKPAGQTTKKRGEVIRWYDREDHELFDVCANPNRRKKLSGRRGGSSSSIRMKSVMPDIPRLAEESQKTSTQPGITKGSPISEAFQTHRSLIVRSRQRKKLRPGFFRTPRPTAALRTNAFSKKSFLTLTARQKVFFAGRLKPPGRSWKRSCGKNQGLISGPYKRSYPFTVGPQDGFPG
jgi:hypothetical protein